MCTKTLWYVMSLSRDLPHPQELLSPEDSFEDDMELEFKRDMLKCVPLHGG